MWPSTQEAVHYQGGDPKKPAVLFCTNQGERQRNRVHGQRGGERQEESESQRSHVLPSDHGTCP